MYNIQNYPTVELLNEKEAAKILGVSVYTLQKWRYKKNHSLPYAKYGHNVRYAKDDVYNYIQNHTHKG